MRSVDFLPETYRQARRRRAQRLRRLGLGAAGLCLLASWFAVDEMRLHRSRRQLQGLVSQNETVQAGLEQIARLQAEQTVLLDKYRLLSELQSPISDVEALFRIAQVLPEHVAVRQVQIACVPAEPPAGGTPAGTTAGATPTPPTGTNAAGPVQTPEPVVPRVALLGMAMSQVDIAVLVGQLSGCREFANVRLDYSKAAELDSRQTQEFRVTFDVLGLATATQQAAGA